MNPKINQSRWMDGKRVSAACLLALVVLYLAVLLLIPLPALAVAPSGAPRPALPAGLTADPAVQAMINLVDVATLTTLAGDLTGHNSPLIDGAPYQFRTRYTDAATPAAKATQYVYSYLAGLGLSVQFKNWSAGGSSGRNVVAEQSGTRLANPCIYLVTAHVDSTNDDGNPITRAPGADDNASGAVGVMMAAKALKSHQFLCTLRYLVTTGEEQDLYGSAAYANAAAAAREPILGVINLDMIGYKTNSTYNFEVIFRSGAAGDRQLATLVEYVNSTYQLGLIPVEDASGEADSDQASFWDAGYPAIWFFEDSTDSTPYYHTGEDTFDTLNTTYAAQIVKVVVGTLAHLAGPTSPAVPTPTAISTPVLPPPAPAHASFLPMAEKQDAYWYTKSGRAACRTLTYNVAWCGFLPRR